MISSEVTLFVSAMVLNALSPGPTNAVVAARTLVGDALGAVMFSAGNVLGNLALVVMVYLGLAIWLRDNPAVLGAAKWAYVAWLLFMADGLMRNSGAPSAPGRIRPGRAGRAMLVATGCLSSMVNPQWLVFYIITLPSILGQQGVSLMYLGQICALTALILTVMKALVIGVTAGGRRFLIGRGPMQGVRQISALVIAGAALWIAAGAVI